MIFIIIILKLFSSPREKLGRRSIVPKMKLKAFSLEFLFLETNFIFPRICFLRDKLPILCF